MLNTKLEKIKGLFSEAIITYTFGMYSGINENQHDYAEFIESNERNFFIVTTVEFGKTEVNFLLKRIGRVGYVVFKVFTKDSSFDCDDCECISYISSFLSKNIDFDTETASTFLSICENKNVDATEYNFSSSEKKLILSLLCVESVIDH